LSSLKEYAELFERLNLSEMQVEEGNFKLVMKGQSCCPGTECVPEKSPETKKQIVESTSETIEVKAPLLGVFHADAEDGQILQVGGKVEKGDVMCSIEAMKLFNDVKAPEGGTIKEILVKDGELVEYNQTLFILSANSETGR
jgi:acetyl-CoA carboxylase biotin carboxyl carrier protein